MPAFPGAAGSGLGDPYSGIGGGLPLRVPLVTLACIMPLVGCAGLGGAAVFLDGWCLKARDGEGTGAAQARH